MKRRSQATNTNGASVSKDGPGVPLFFFFGLRSRTSASAGRRWEGSVQSSGQTPGSHHVSPALSMISLAILVTERRSVADRKSPTHPRRLVLPYTEDYRVFDLTDTLPGRTGDGSYVCGVVKRKMFSWDETPGRIDGIDVKACSKPVKDIRSQIRRKRRMNVDLARKTHSVDWRHGQICEDSEVAGCTAKRRAREIGIERRKTIVLPRWEKEILASEGLEKENTVGQAPGPRSEEGGPPP